MSGKTENPRHSGICRFGVFEFDWKAGQLRKRGSKLRLSGQPFEILRLLMERPGEIVTREKLRGLLWADGTNVDFDHGLNAAINKLRETLGDSAGHPRYVETIPRRGYRFIASVQAGPGAPLPLPARATRKHIRSLAVLPLENLSGDPEQEYFADGMTEALMTDLAKISALRVISRASVMRYKGTRKSLGEIARELNVDGVVQGSVLRIGSRVRITAQLIHVPSDTHVWAERYEQDVLDVLSLQSEVAQAIAAEIRVTVAPHDRARLGRARGVIREAHEAYLRGRYHWNKRTPQALQKALEYFQQAIDADPAYALAYAGIADVYLILGGVILGVICPREAMPKARAAANKALEVDETLGEAHAALAFVSWLYDYDWKAAERGFLRALELNPGYSTAHQWYAVFLSHRGRTNEAIAAIERARQLDPLSLQINSAVVQVLYFGRAYDRAIEQARKALDLDPTFSTTHLMQALAYMQKGMLADALAAGENAATCSGRSAASLACIGGCYAALGRKREAEKIIDELAVLSKHKYVDPYVVAWVHANLGDAESTLSHLEHAFAEQSGYLATIRAEPTFDFLRSDPRFQDLHRRVGLSP